MPVETTRELYEADDLIIEERIVALEDGETHVYELPDRIPDSNVLLMVQAIEGDLYLDAAVPLEEVDIETHRDKGRVWQGDATGLRDAALHFMAKGSSRIRIIYTQIRKNFVRRLRAMPCGFCKFAIKVIVNFVLLFHGCPAIPGGSFDASSIGAALVQVDAAIANGKFGPVVEALASVLPAKFWDQVVIVMQIFNLVFKITDFFLTMICVRIGLCPAPPPAAGATP